MDFNIQTYLALVFAGVIGAILVLPYSLELNRERFAKIPMSLPKLLILSMIQNIVMLVIFTALGLLAANSIGLSITSPIDSIPLTIVIGLIGSGTMLMIESKIFQPRLPDAMKQAAKRATLWKGFLASFYGGITEEILVRLFVMSGIVWLLGHIWQTPTDAPADGAYWLGIVLAALIFGLLHLPATAAITPLTPMLIIRAILLNGIGGLVFGWLFWQYGLIAAMVSHFTFDIVLHVIAAKLLDEDQSSWEADLQNT